MSETSNSVKVNWKKSFVVIYLFMMLGLAGIQGALSDSTTQ